MLLRKLDGVQHDQRRRRVHLLLAAAICSPPLSAAADEVVARDRISRFGTPMHSKSARRALCAADAARHGGGCDAA